MNEMVIIDKFVKPVIEKRQVIFRTLDNPVGHSVCLKVDPILFVCSGLTSERKCIIVFTIHDRSQ